NHEGREGRNGRRMVFKFARIASTRSLRHPCGMNALLVRLAAFTFFTIFALPAASRADEADKAGEQAKLVTRVYRVTSSCFRSVFPSDVKITGSDTTPKKLPPTADG